MLNYFNCNPVSELDITENLHYPHEKAQYHNTQQLGHL